MRMIADALAASLHAFVKDCIHAGSAVHTDGWQGYAGLDSTAYPREIHETEGTREGGFSVDAARSTRLLRC